MKYSPKIFNSTSLVLLVLVVILVVSLYTVLVFSKHVGYRPGYSDELDRVVEKAQVLLKEKKKTGIDLSDGPCLTNDLLPDWAADLVHNPKISQDNLLENQCASYLENRVNHLIELSLDGKVIRVK